MSIAYSDLKQKRAVTPLRVAAGGTLADYVPFYYAPRSPMLYAIATGYVSSYQGQQDEIVHIVSSVEALATAGRFAITDGHPISPLSSQFGSMSALDTELDWAIMNDAWWNDTDADGDRKRRRQAEFLVHECAPMSAVSLIGVMNDTAALRVASLVAGLVPTPAVRIRSDWYY